MELDTDTLESFREIVLFARSNAEIANKHHARKLSVLNDVLEFLEFNEKSNGTPNRHLRSSPTENSIFDQIYTLGKSVDTLVQLKQAQASLIAPLVKGFNDGA